MAKKSRVMSKFRIAISSSFKELWRYNLVAICELCSADGERLDYKAEESFIAPVGSNLKGVPMGYDDKRTILIESGEGDFVNILLYVIPHTLPSSDDIYAVKPFALVVKVERDAEIVVNQSFEINQWSGDNISLERVGGPDK